jgi:hypothetical protein
MTFEQINDVLDSARRQPLGWRDVNSSSLLDLKGKIAGVIAIAPHIPDDIVRPLQLSPWRVQQTLFKPI